MALNNASINKWRWGQNAFVNPGELSTVIPSYYDAPVPDANLSCSGPVDISDIKIKDASTGILLSGGYFAANASFLPVFGSDHFQKSITLTTVPLPIRPSFSQRPFLGTFRYIIKDDKLVIGIKRNFKLQIVDELDEHGFAIDGLNVKTSQLHDIDYAESLSVAATLTGGTKVFALSEFPATNLIVVDNLTNKTVDAANGLVFTTDNVNSISVTYTSYPVLFYAVNSVLDNNILIDLDMDPDSFLSIKLSANNSI